MIRSIILLNMVQRYDVRMWSKFEDMGLEPDAFISDGEKLWDQLGITERGRDVMRRAIRDGAVDREIEKCERRHVRMITCRDGIYPRSLLELEDAPLMLYVRGPGFTPGRDATAVVGTRRCSSYGASVARDIGRRGAAENICIVSGGAKGIDAAAHIGCLEEGGRTIVVMGTGLDCVYPADHRGLFERVAERGALISEYPFGASGESWRFPRRNRVIVGLSSRVAVVEAPHKSGAMITARFASEASREVWAVPGRINEERCAGSNALIFDGALPMIDLDAMFGVQSQQRSLFSNEDAPKKNISLDEDERTIASLLTESGDRTIDNLASEAKMSAAEVFKIMSVLSLKGVVRSSGPGRYRLDDDAARLL